MSNLARQSGAKSYTDHGNGPLPADCGAVETSHDGTPGRRSWATIAHRPPPLMRVG